MKRTQVVELFATIRRTLVSFFSILMFATLGIGVYLGISWAAPALERAANQMIDEGSFHSFQIQYPYGLTDGDLETLSEVEGVSNVEGAYQSYQSITVADERLTIKVQTLGQSIDTALVVEGTLPTKADEIAFHAASAEDLGISIGDIVTFEQDADADEETDSAEDDANESGMKYLTNQSFKVTALVNSPEYLADYEEAYGIAPTPSGVVSGMAWVTTDAFDESEFHDGYPIVNAQCNELDELDAFSAEYKALSGNIEARISDLGNALAKARYDDLRNEAQKKIDDAQAQIDDANAQIADGEQQIADGERELEEKKAEGQAKLDAAYSELIEGEAAKADGKARIAQAQAQVDDAQRQIEEAEALMAAQASMTPADAAAYMMQQNANPQAATFDLDEARAKTEEAKQQLAEAQAEYDRSVAELNAGWSQYYAQKSEYESRIAEGEAKLDEARQKVEEGKEKVAENEPKLEDAKAQLADMQEYDWTILPTAYNPGANEVSMFGGVTNSLSISMATLFIIVGLLVSYFAISRMVREQITQIGTKKALGFRRGETTTAFLCYAGLSVLAGAIAGGIVAYTIVEGIIGSVLADMFAFGTYRPYFGWELFLFVTLLYLALALGTTYLACRSILKQHAVDLLRGPTPPPSKTRFYEKLRIWSRLPLLIQTIINNCVNDKRRVLSTVVGVAGATALIVTAITLNNDVLKSYDKQYEDVYGFNVIAYVDSDAEQATSDVEDALQDEGATTAQVNIKSYRLEQPNGESGFIRVITPMNSETFAGIYQANITTGTAFDPSADGVWVSQAYAEHFGAQVGDTLLVDDDNGTQHKLPILGFYEFWISSYEALMGQEYYEAEFGSVSANAVLANTDETPVYETRTALSQIEGFDSLIDDKTNQHINFEMFSQVSSAVVAIYLALAALMAIVVLLNLNVMFIEEKKRELIVLMINGFSVKDARHYISYDNIVLTALGIIAGLALGCIMGSVTVASVEPITGTFVKSIDSWAVIIGVLGSAVLAIIMSFVALSRIRKFKLTDINKF